MTTIHSRDQLSKMWAQATRRAERTRLGTDRRTLDAVHEWYRTRDMFDPPGVRDIAQLSGLGIGTVSEALRRLSRRGLVKYTGKARGCWLPEHAESA